MLLHGAQPDRLELLGQLLVLLSVVTQQGWPLLIALRIAAIALPGLM